MMKAFIAIGILASLNAFVYWRILKTSPLLAAAFFTLQLLGPFGDRLFFPVLKAYAPLSVLVLLLDWASYLALGLLACLVFFGIIAEFIKWGNDVLHLTDPVSLQRRSVMTVGLASAGSAAMGVGQAMAGPLVKRITIDIKSLPASFDGFQIVQISDLHAGPIIGRDYIRNVVNIANGLQPDLIALTGDFVDGSVTGLQDDIAPLGQLWAPYGVFFVTGNHEYYWGAEAWQDKFQQLGAQVLNNAHHVIAKGQDHLIVAGIPDLSTLRRDDIPSSSVKDALAGAPPGLVKILLAHQPGSYEMASEAGIDLQLSGHTHAGQFFPFSLIIPLFHRYYRGLNRHENTWIYVNCGTGFWGPPIRTGVPAEITLLTLRTASPT